MAVALSKRDMSDLLVTAWEGGSNYWVEFAEYQPPSGMTYEDLKRAAWEALPSDEKKLWKDEGPTGRWPLYVGLPYLPPSVEWKIKLKPEGERAVHLTPENMRDAVLVLVEKYPHIFARIKSGDYDASDADAWLQAAVFGEVVYG